MMGCVDVVVFDVYVIDFVIGEVLGGFIGWMLFGLFFIDLFYLFELLCGGGFGSWLLCEVEVEVKWCGCVCVVLYMILF